MNKLRTYSSEPPPGTAKGHRLLPPSPGLEKPDIVGVADECFMLWVKRLRRFQHFYWLNLYQGQSSGAVKCSGSVEHWLLVSAEKGDSTSTEGRAPKLHLVLPDWKEGEEEPNLPLLLAQGFQAILSATSGTMDCCFIHGPKPKEKVLRQKCKVTLLQLEWYHRNQ